MDEYQNTIITNAGISILNRVLSGKATATFTRAVSSTDDLSGKTESELRAMTGFSSVMQNGVCSRYDIHSSNMVSLDLLFTNENLGNSYMINAVGLYAKASDSSSEILYAIARAGKDAGGNSLAEQMPAYAGNLTKFTISLYTQVGQASSVSVSITDEGVVKSINGRNVTPDVNGDVIIDDSSHAKFIEAELIHGHLLVPLVDSTGSPITDPAGNQLVADEYLPKSVTLGNHPAIYPGTDNAVRLPVYTQAEVDAMLSAKADTTSVTTREDVDAQTGLIYGMLAQNRLVTPLADGNGTTLLDESGNALMSETRAVTSVNGKTPGADGNINIDDYYSKQAIDNRLEVKADLLQMEDEHKALQAQITDNADHLGTVDDMLDQHAKQIVQATGEASYALDQISTGQTLTALSDGQGGYLTDEHGNPLLTGSRLISTVKLGGQIYTPDSAGNVNLDTYSKKEINNLVDSLKLAIDQVKALIK
ncbi:hypothetical protein EFM17_00730 [Lactobacillus delbrueckii]|nr:hypothetical protein [Lactobacillus delbrueckii]